MSQSPTKANLDVTTTRYQPFLKSQARLYDLVRAGKSFSGNERNCCYLNVDGQRFANVSSVTGFDLADDTRALATVDWDRDGDLDIWSTNRTAPRLRFLRNDVASDNRVFQLRLQGTRSNRDAIGARVELHVEHPTPAILVRQLNAGEGFLSQSSKLLHFGLGRKSQIERIVVHWPSGTSETLEGPELNDPPTNAYELIEGQGPASQAPRSTVTASCDGKCAAFKCRQNNDPIRAVSCRRPTANRVPNMGW